MLATPPEFADALREHGWTHDGTQALWWNEQSFVAVENGGYYVGVLARGIQPMIRREVTYEAALAWVRRDLDAFIRLANRRSKSG